MFGDGWHSARTIETPQKNVARPSQNSLSFAFRSRSYGKVLLRAARARAGGKWTELHPAKCWFSQATPPASAVFLQQLTRSYLSATGPQPQLGCGRESLAAAEAAKAAAPDAATSRTAHAAALTTLDARITGARAVLGRNATKQFAAGSKIHSTRL